VHPSGVVALGGFTRRSLAVRTAIVKGDPGAWPTHLDVLLHQIGAPVDPTRSLETLLQPMRLILSDGYRADFVLSRCAKKSRQLPEALREANRRWIRNRVVLPYCLRRQPKNRWTSERMQLGGDEVEATVPSSPLKDLGPARSAHYRTPLSADRYALLIESLRGHLPFTGDQGFRMPPPCLAVQAGCRRRGLVWAQNAARLHLAIARACVSHADSIPPMGQESVLGRAQTLESVSHDMWLITSARTALMRPWARPLVAGCVEASELRVCRKETQAVVASIIRPLAPGVGATPRSLAYNSHRGTLELRRIMGVKREQGRPSPMTIPEDGEAQAADPSAGSPTVLEGRAALSPVAGDRNDFMRLTDEDRYMKDQDALYATSTGGRRARLL